MSESEHKYKCIECNFIGTDEEWIESEIGCEDCGSHPAYECPNCGHVHDEIYNYTRRIEIF